MYHNVAAFEKPTFDCLVYPDPRVSSCCFSARNGTGRRQLEVEAAVSIVVSSTLVASRGVTGQQWYEPKTETRFFGRFLSVFPTENRFYLSVFWLEEKPKPENPLGFYRSFFLLSLTPVKPSYMYGNPCINVRIRHTRHSQHTAHSP